MVAIALQAAVLSRKRIAWFGATDADHTDLGVVFERSLILWRGAVGKLPDAHPVVPAAPVVDHGTIPGRARRNDGDQYPTRHEQQAGVGDDAVLGALAVLEEVGRVGQHQAHAPPGNTHTLEGAGDEFGLWEACAGNGGAFGGDFHTIEPGQRDLTARQEQVALSRRWVEHSGGLSLREGQEAAHDPVRTPGPRA